MDEARWLDLLNASETHLAASRPVEAIHAAERAVDLAKAADGGLGPRAAIARVGLAMALAAGGEPNAALAEASAAREGLDALAEPPALELAYAELIEASLTATCGRLPIGIAKCRGAVERLQCLAPGERVARWSHALPTRNELLEWAQAELADMERLDAAVVRMEELGRSMTDADFAQLAAELDAGAEAKLALGKVGQRALDECWAMLDAIESDRDRDR